MGGSEASALTGVILDIRTARVPQVITVDRPFLFYIYDKEHNVPLFMGRIMDPSNGAAEFIQETQSNVRPGLQEVVTDDDGFETEIIEFRNAVGRFPLNSGKISIKKSKRLQQIVERG